MQKVITITSSTGIMKRDNSEFIESEYPELNKYLEQGFEVKKTIPIIKPSDQGYTYAVVFILEDLENY